MDERFDGLLIPPEASIRDAMAAIQRGACEIALVVDLDRRLVGTVSDGDVRRSLLAGHSMDDPVAPHISKEPRVAAPTAGRAEILDMMKAHSIAELPVVDEDGHLVALHVLQELLGSSVRPNAAVIMAGGRGTRLAPVTNVLPKPMVPVAGRPILERLVLHLVGWGIRHIVLSVNYMAGVIEDHFKGGDDFGCRIDYVRENPARPLGTGGSLSLLTDIAELPEEPLLVINGDLLTQFSVGDLFDHHQASGAVATMGIRDYSHEVQYGVVHLTADGCLTALHEKPVVTWPINAGVYVLDPALLARIPNEVFQLPDLLSDCVARGERVSTWYLDDEWHDIGQHVDLRRATGRG